MDTLRNNNEPSTLNPNQDALRKAIEQGQELMIDTEIQKPAVLYHASQSGDITVFEPRAESVRDKTEGPVVFATPDKAYASMFIVPSNDSWTKKGRFSKDEPWYIVIGDEARFRQTDHGGAIYALPSDQFVSDPLRNMPGTEWTSKDPVQPSEVEDYSSGLEAMRNARVDIFFVDEATFSMIDESDDHGHEIISRLRETRVTEA